MERRWTFLIAWIPTTLIWTDQNFVCVCGEHELIMQAQPDDQKHTECLLLRIVLMKHFYLSHLPRLYTPSRQLRSFAGTQVFRIPSSRFVVYKYIRVCVRARARVYVCVFKMMCKRFGLVRIRRTQCPLLSFSTVIPCSNKQTNSYKHLYNARTINNENNPDDLTMYTLLSDPADPPSLQSPGDFSGA